MSPNPDLQVRICVFCSTKVGSNDSGSEAARRLAQALHDHDVELVYGGGSTGLMGELSRVRTKLGGIEAVIGVIPYALIDQERDVPGKTSAARSKLNGMLSALGVSKAASKAAELQASDEIYDLPSDPEYGRVIGVPSLARRKKLMIDLVQKGGKGSGFIALPGAFGSLDEVLEVLTYRQLGVHNRPMVLVNTDGFWEGIGIWMDNAAKKGFLGEASKGFVEIVETPEEAQKFFMLFLRDEGWPPP